MLTKRLLILPAFALACLCMLAAGVRPASALCGDPTGDGEVKTTDALTVLKEAVNIEVECPLCLCDVDSSGAVKTTDALLTLKEAVNIDVTLTCPSCDGSTLTCDSGYEANSAGTACVDIDECTAGTDDCTGDSTCANTAGSYACGIECTQAAFETALAGCGGTAKTIVFGCSDQTITISSTGDWSARKTDCDGLTIDGNGQNIVFELDPPCFGDSSDLADSDVCPSDGGDGFMRLLGDGSTVRDLTLRYFQEGITTKGSSNTVESVTFERHCGESLINDGTGSANLFKDVTINNGCGTCARLYGDQDQVAVSNPADDAYYNAVIDGAVFDGCDRPVTAQNGGRYLIRDSEMKVSDSLSDFSCRGPLFTTLSSSDTTVVYMNDTTVSDCSQGVKVTGSGTTEAVFTGNTISDCARRGILAKGSVKLSMRQSSVRSNGASGTSGSDGGTGGVIVAGTASVDLGGGSLTIDGQTVDSPGGNTICGNTGSDGAANDVENGLDDSSASIPAENNYWCGQDVSASTSGTVDADPELSSEPSCGDGTVVADVEECDDGNSSNLDECTNRCLDAVCGDGYTRTDTEQCDDANSDNTDACVSIDTTGDGSVDTYCRTAVCGDGLIRNGVETCDDEGETATCDSDCTAVSCGDGVTNATAGEECDSAGEVTSECNSDCTAASCGDGVVNTTAGEECDNGAANNDATADACRTDCQLASCGDGVTDDGESCDNGAANSNTEVNACRSNCKAARCRDGVVDTAGEDGAEECDDDNNSNTDSCLNTCVAASCGDGYTYTGVESCDGGTSNSDSEPDTCRTDCTMPACGDGVVDPNGADGLETCDNGSSNDDTTPDACRTTCQPAFCGDGVTDPNGADGEEVCDDGTANSDVTADACRTDCYLAQCGDGVIDTAGLDGAEACDDGNPFDTDECATSCASAVCGDGYVHKGSEACDDGGTADGDGCSATCTREECLTIGSTEHCATCASGADLSQVCAADNTAVCTSDADCGSCSDGSYTTQTDCETSLATWTADSCSDGSYTTQTDCETSLATWTADSCSDDSSTTETACVDGGGTWTAGSCSNGSFTTQAACEAPRGDWTAGSCSNGSFTTQAACVAPRGDWTADSCTSAACLCSSGYELFGGFCFNVDECGYGSASANACLSDSDCSGLDWNAVCDSSGFCTHDCGACSDPQYYFKGDCEGAGETWTLDSGKCVDKDGGYTCPIECTIDAFNAALTNCGGAGGFITFDCQDTTIEVPIPNDPYKWGTRQVSCDNMVIDGAGSDGVAQNITFELEPRCGEHFEQFIAAGALDGTCSGGSRDGQPCNFDDCSSWGTCSNTSYGNQTDCETAGGTWENDCSYCPDGGDCQGETYAFSDGTLTTESGACTETERGTGFVRLKGDNNVVRNLTVQHFYEGLQVHGSYNLVENVDFSHMCDDGPGSTTGKGNYFRNFTISEGCDKCIQNEGDVHSLGDCSDTQHDGKVDCEDAGETWTPETDELADDYYHAIFENITTINCSKPFRMSGGGRFKIMDSEMKTEGDHPHCKGPLFNLTTSDYADEKRSVVYIEDTIVDNCQEGIGFTGTAEGVLRRNTVTNCARRGVLVTKNSKISMTGNVIRYNGGELSSEKGFGGVAAWDNDNELFSPQMDLGGGSIEIDGKTMTSDGFNIICGNLYKSAWPLKWDIHNLSESDQTAENNWWCNTDPSDIGDNQIWEINGSVDYLPIVRRQPWWMPTYTTQATCEAAAGNWGASASSCTWE